MKIWLYFILAQCVQAVATILGWLILLPFCALKAWTPPNGQSIKDKRLIDSWKWSLLNYIYGNPEDGVSGKQALIWVNGVQQEYLPTSREWVRAYRWSALRNSCDNLKYVFSIPMVWNHPTSIAPEAMVGGPIKYWWKFKFGYQVENGYNVPVIGRK